MCDEVSSGMRTSLYRERNEIKRAKDLKGGISAASWFLGGDVKSVISCQATPGGMLADMIRKEIGITKDGQKRLVMEEGGIPVTLGLKVSNPVRTEGCQFGDNACIVKKGDCSTMGCIYCITCNKCNEELDINIKQVPSSKGGMKSSHYLGMTMTSAHNRMLAHRQGHVSKKNNNPLHKHDLEAHNGDVQQYSATVVQKEGSLLHLTMREAILLESQLHGTSMNDRYEKGRGEAS